MSDLEKLSAELAAANINYDNLLADHVIVEREYYKLRAEVEQLKREARFNDISVLPEKDAEYASLRAENEKMRAAAESFWRAWQDRAVKAEAENARLTARIRELDRVLEPFALAANNFDNYGRAIADPTQWFAYGGTICPDGQIGAISVADLRAARAIYKGETNCGQTKDHASHKEPEV